MRTPHGGGRSLRESLPTGTIISTEVVQKIFDPVTQNAAERGPDLASPITAQFRAHYSASPQPKNRTD